MEEFSYKEQIIRMREQIMQYVQTYQATYYELPGYIEGALEFLVEQVVSDQRSNYMNEAIQESNKASKAMTENIFAFLDYNNAKQREIDKLQQELAQLTILRSRPVDDELVQALDTMDALYSAEDIQTILAKVAGDTLLDAHWHWVAQLKNEKYMYVHSIQKFEHNGEGELVAVGFDSGSYMNAKSAEKAAMLAPLEEHYKEVRASLLAQIRGEVPYEHVSHKPLSAIMKEKTGGA